MSRVLSALLLIPLVLGVVWFLPPVATLLLAAVAAASRSSSTVRLAKALGIDVQRAVAAVTAVAACVAVGYGCDSAGRRGARARSWPWGSRRSRRGSRGRACWRRSPRRAFGLVYIGVPLGAVAAIRTIGGREAVLLLMATIVVSDSAQYYTGRAFGRAPLAPSISPKKTREGAIGGRRVRNRGDDRRRPLRVSGVVAGRPRGDRAGGGRCSASSAICSSRCSSAAPA